MGQKLGVYEYHIKDGFLEVLCDSNEIIELYLPNSLSNFWYGYKAWFLKDDKICAHAKYMLPI